MLDLFAGQREEQEKKLEEARDFRQFTVIVHALKGEARGIGADALGEMFAVLEQAGKEEDQERIREMLPEGEKLDLLKEEIPMYVMTNEKRCLGACGILYDHILQEAARLLEESFYVLPSSVHECILVPEEAAPEAAELLSMVREINLTQVPLEEVLSDQVYHYDAKTHHLTMAFPH